MPVDITFFGHSGFLFVAGEHRLAVDPFLTDNPLATLEPGDVTCNHIALTHGHGDHFGDTIDLATTHGATVYAAFEITEYLGEKGVQNVSPGNPGGRIETDFGWIAFTQAFHSSSYDGRYMGMPCGLVVNIGGVTIYHCGDTGLFSDMKLIGEIYRPDIACIPIGDRFTMGPALATRAAELIRPRVAIPIHYRTFPVLVQSMDGFAPEGIRVREMVPGETWSDAS